MQLANKQRSLASNAIQIILRKNTSNCADDGNSWSQKFGSDEERDPTYIKKASTAALKRGTGGRSSFSGIVATVFGSSGFLGRYVANKLGKIGSQLILPYRGDADEMRSLKLVGDLGQVNFLKYDLRDEENICKAVKYSNTVVNLVGRDWETKNFKFEDVHVDGARRIARIARAAKVDKFVHVSALNATEEPTPFFLKNGSEWLRSKYLGEQAVLEEFPDAIIIRPSNIVGTEDRFTRYFSSIWRHQLDYMPIYKAETTVKQPVYVGDVAAGIVKAIKDSKLKGTIIQAVGPRRYYLSELVDWFHRINRKDKANGRSYRRYNLKFDPLMRLRISLQPFLTPNRPLGDVTWESVERECHPDLVDCSLKTLQDLGVKLTLMEDIVPWVLRPYKSMSYYFDQYGEFVNPEPPRYITEEDEQSGDSDTDDEDDNSKVKLIAESS